MAENTRNEEKPNDEDLRTKKPTTSSNQSKATVRDHIEDVVAYINRAREAQEIAAHDLEKANNWLNKSEELLAEVLAVFSAGDTPKETQSYNPDAVVDNVDTNVNGLNPDTSPEQARIQNNHNEAETHNILEAEQLKMEVKLFPAKPKNDEKPSVSSSYSGVTVEGNPEDVEACINNGAKAFAENDLEEAKKWLIKSQRMRCTVNAQELLNQVLAAIAARDALKEIPNVNTNAGPNNDKTNSIVDLNPEQARTRTPTETPSGPTVHNDDVGAKKFIDNANKAFKAGEFDKAERLLLKAKRMDAGIDVEQYLKLVRESKARDITSRENAVPEERPLVPEPIKQTNHNMDEANTYLTVAENAFNDKRYERALQFLDKSEALFTLERAVKLREQVQDAMSNPKKLFVENCTSYIYTREKPSKPSRKEELDKLITAIRNDIDAGNLDEAERKLQTPGFAKAVKLKKLRTEVEEKKALRTIEDEPKIKDSNPEPVYQTKSLRIKMLSDIRAKEAETCIHVAEKAYYDGNLDKAERLLKKAERLYPTEQAKKYLEILITAKEEKKRLETTESIVNKVKQLIDSGRDDMEKQNYYSAEWAFQNAKRLQPGSKYIDELLTDVQTKIKNGNAITGTSTFSTPESMEGTSMGTQNRQNEKPTHESDPIAAATKHTDWAQAAYNSDNIAYAEYFLKLAEALISTERTRELFVTILKAKHGVKTTDSDDDDANSFSILNLTRKKVISKEDTIIKGKSYLRSAEEAFIKGNFKEARNLITKSEVLGSFYVTELKEKIINSHTGNFH